MARLVDLFVTFDNAIFVFGVEIATENNRVAIMIKGLPKKKNCLTALVGTHDTLLKSVRRSLDPVHCVYVWVDHCHTHPFGNNWDASFD